MRAREFIFESTNIASAEQVWDYVDTIHPKDQQGGGFLKSLVMKYPDYELKRVPLSSIHIPDQEYDDEEQDSKNNDPYNRAMFVDPEHAGEYSQHYVDQNPIVIDAEGYILDGNHRAWAAAELLNKTDIMAWVPVKTRTSTPQDLEIRNVTEDSKNFNQCYEKACQVFDRAEDKKLDPVLLQVAGYNGDGSNADSKWLKMPQRVWQHYVVVVGNTVYDPTATQFGDDKLTKYSVKQLQQDWDQQYQIRPKQGVAEGLDDNRVSFKVQKGKNKFATTLSVGVNPVGVYQYDADTGRSVAEVYPEFKGKGLGKLLVLHAIYTAAKLGLDFQEDESRTSEYDNVLDSLSSNGYIVDDDGYWYVTGEGEQYLQHSLKQGVADYGTEPAEGPCAIPDPTPWPKK